MKTSSILSKLLLSAYAATTLLAPLTAAAATQSATQDTTVTVGSHSLVVKAGSTYDSLTTTSDSLTVTVPAGEAFVLKYPQPAMALENDAGLPTCDIQRDLSNQLTINGPRTVVIRPTTNACSTTGASSDDTPAFAFSKPLAGETLQPNTTYQLFWSAEGRLVASVRIRLSVDGGVTYPQMVADGLANNGFYQWSVPLLTRTTQARLKIEGFDQGNIVALAVSPLFTLEGNPPPAATGPTLTVTPYDYDPDEETRSAATAGIDKNLPAAPQSQLICHPDSRIKAREFDTVYYCGRDGKRYVFPNRKTHDSWYGTFAGVIELDLATMQQIPLGGNVTYRPGVRLLKIQSAPDVFAVAADGTLRYVSPTAVVRLYGPDWATKLDDLPDPFFVDYVIGDAIME